MGKVKTHSGAAKRFRLTKSGKVKKTSAYRRHIAPRSAVWHGVSRREVHAQDA